MMLLMRGAKTALGAAVRSGEMSALCALFLAGFLAFGVGVYAFTQFLAPVQVEFGWSRAVVGGLMSAFWVAAPFVLLAAYALDFFGVRVVIFAGAAIEAVGLVWMTRLSTPAEFFAVRFAMGVGKCLIVTPVPIAAARWFRARTGMACAVALSGWHVGGLVMAPLAAWLIQGYGWRPAAWVLAALMLAGMAVTLRLLKAPAEPARSSLGTPSSAASHSGPSSFAHPWVLGLIGVATLVYYAGYATFLSQLTPLLGDVGFSARGVATATASVAVFAALGTLLGGAGTQLFTPYRAVGVLLLLMAGLELAAMALHSGLPWIVIAAWLTPLGLVIGGGDPILIEALRRCTPPRYYNRCYGWWYLTCLASLAAAPVLAGSFFDRHASYRGLFWTLMLGTAVTALAWMITTRPARSPAVAAAFRLQGGVPHGERRA